MKKLYNFTLFALVLMLSGCDSYLDRQPDEALTSKEIFQKYATTLKYLENVYAYIPDLSDPSGQNLFVEPNSDECSVVFTGRKFSLVNQNTWTPSSNTCYSFTYNNMYLGIREATYFMQHVYDCPDLSLSEANQWYAEARFMRAYYYYNIMSFYGPCFLLGNEPVDFKLSDLNQRERNTWDDCVKYVCDELDACVVDLPFSHPSTWYGRATKGAARALKARLLLYSARPLFNGNPLYKDLITKNGENLFPVNYDVNKWKLAADAAKAVIDMDYYILIGENDNNPYESLKDVFITNCNQELIFVTQRTRYVRSYVPRGAGGNGYGGVAPTQKLVDAFAMANGRYPITGYTDDGATPIIDPASDYEESGFSTFVNPYSKASVNTMKMYQNREPRFYINVFWAGQTWTCGNNVYKDVQFFYGGTSGPGASHNFSPTGYMFTKFVDPKLDTKNGVWGNVSWPIIRYAEILLDYVEALNEYDPSDPDILLQLNRVRKRAGVPNIEDAYPEAVGDQAKMRELIHRERQVELCFENQRYFDTRTWMTAEQDDNGPIYGMNIMAKNQNANGEFWKRTVVLNDGGYIGIRSFTPRCYLYPIPQAEVDRVDFTQNYGW